MVQPLTGKEAVEALGLAVRLGNRNARFDRRSLSDALRSRAGRLRVAAGLTLAVQIPRFHGERRSRGRATRTAGRPLLPARALAAPERPERPRPSSDAEIGS